MKRYQVRWLEIRGTEMPSHSTLTVETEEERDELMAYINGHDRLQLVWIAELG